jgi:sulfite reductase alpha subunit-like flavoprotein
MQLHDTTILKITNTAQYHRKTRVPNLTCTYHDLLTLYLDLAGRPKRSFFECIAPYAQSTEEREKLVELASPAGTDIFFEYCIRERRNFVEVLEDFSSLRVPLSTLISLLPAVQPRPYSVATHGALFPDQVWLYLQCIHV